MTKIRIGTCSPAEAATPQASLALVETLARQASAQGVDILLLPEAFLGGGYPRGSTLGSDHSAFLSYFQKAVDFGDIVGEKGAGGGEQWVTGGQQQRGSGSDGTRETLERIANESGVFLVVGAVEKAASNLYSAVVYVCPREGVVGKRRKVQASGLERLIWSNAGPASLRPVSTEIRGVRINLATAIGCENYMPLVRQVLYAQNVNLYLAPMTDDRDTWLPLVQTISIEGHCFVATSIVSTSPTRRTAQPSNQRTVSAKSMSSTPAAADCSAIAYKIVHCVSADGKTRPRKKSFVLDEDGNEIVLSCQAVEEEDEEDTNRDQVNGTQSTNGCAPDPALPPLPPFPRVAKDEAWERHKHRRRRSSVFDKDDNEIVLPRPVYSGTNGDAAVDEEADESRPTTVFNNPFATAQTIGTSAHTSISNTDGQAPDAETLSQGVSAIVSPFGKVLAGPRRDGPKSIVVADVDFEDCIRGRMALHVGGHGSHINGFRLSVEGLNVDALA